MRCKWKLLSNKINDVVYIMIIGKLQLIISHKFVDGVDLYSPTALFSHIYTIFTFSLNNSQYVCIYFSYIIMQIG